MFFTRQDFRNVQVPDDVTVLLVRKLHFFPASFWMALSSILSWFPGLNFLSHQMRRMLASWRYLYLVEADGPVNAEPQGRDRDQTGALDGSGGRGG